MLKKLVTIIALLFSPLVVLASGVVINEVLFDPAGNDTGKEWIEIYNSGLSPQDMSGWQLYPDGVGYFYFPAGFVLGSGKFVVVHIKDSGINSASDLYYVSTSTQNMGNTSGSAALFSGEPRGKETMRSFVEWGRAGETWETDAAQADLWSKGTFVNTSKLVEGNSLALISDGVLYGGKDAWKVSVSLTPGTLNTGQVSAQNVSSSSTASISQQVQTAGSFYTMSAQTIKVFAGEDRITAVGSDIEFAGIALGLQGAPLTSARFFWDFGDGEFREGRVVSHSFRFPGQYTVGLHVSSGEYAASNYVLVKVLPNQINISEVITDEGGFIRINNPSSVELDIGAWIVEDAEGKKFVMPARTRIGAGASVAFANKVTGLLQGSSFSPIRIFYPNAVLAFTWNQSETKDAASTVASSSRVGLKQAGEGEALKGSLLQILSYPVTSSAAAKESASLLNAVSPTTLFLTLAVVLSIAAAVLFFVIKRTGF